MADIREQILKETLQFREMIPALLREHAGQWVVFRDGEVKSFHGSEDEAYLAALREFGPRGGHIVAQVVEEAPTPVSAGSIFAEF